jgi:hypothetical protein
MGVGSKFEIRNLLRSLESELSFVSFIFFLSSDKRLFGAGCFLIIRACFVSINEFLALELAQPSTLDQQMQTKAGLNSTVTRPETRNAATVPFGFQPVQLATDEQ